MNEPLTVLSKPPVDLTSFGDGGDEPPDQKSFYIRWS